MVLVPSLLAAALSVLGLAASVCGKGYIIQNTATGFVFDDRNSSLSVLSSIITGQRFLRGLPSYQQWNVTAVDGGSFVFSSTRFLRNVTVIEAHADALPGTGLVAELAGSNFEYVNPFGAGTIYSFLLAQATPRLAITAPTVNDGQLTLGPYNASDTLQHWVFYDAVLPSGTSHPDSVLASPIPIPLSGDEYLPPKI